jgi:hypothetical protein
VRKGKTEMLDRIRGGMAVAVCFVFGHVYYEQGRFTGNYSRLGPVFHDPLPIMEIKKNQICPRCGKGLKSKIRLKKGDN